MKRQMGGTVLGLIVGILIGLGVALAVKFDNKTSPQESLIQFKAVTDQGIRYITQGNGSSVAGVLIDAVNKWNERNPDKTVLFLNYAAVDPDFTNDKCSFWHFRFDANSDMKMQALALVALAVGAAGVPAGASTGRQAKPISFW